jgi:hypothetical protein
LLKKPPLFSKKFNSAEEVKVLSNALENDEQGEEEYIISVKTPGKRVVSIPGQQEQQPKKIIVTI